MIEDEEYAAGLNQRLLLCPVTIRCIGNNFIGWNREQILDFEKEIYFLGASDEFASDSDKEIYELLKEVT